MIRKMIGVLLLLSSSFAFANLPYYPLAFPRDEAAHYANIPYDYERLVEWWYFNGKAEADNGKHLSYDIAAFNVDQMIVGYPMVIPFVHIQVADLDAQKSYGVETEFFPGAGTNSNKQLDINLDPNYSLKKVTENGKEVYLLKAFGQAEKTSIQLNLRLEPISAPFLINKTGLMPMLDDTNSYYYSIPRFNTTGTIIVNGVEYKISKKVGDSWMDHQWGDFDVQKHGWEWFSVRLDNGLLANIFMFVDYKGNKVVGGLANLILPNGEQQFIPYEQFHVDRSNYWLDPKLKISFPMTFNITFPSLGLQIQTDAAFPEQEVHGYWEGYTNVKAVYNKQDVNGYAYTELVYQDGGKFKR